MTAPLLGYLRPQWHSLGERSAYATEIRPRPHQYCKCMRHSFHWEVTTYMGEIDIVIYPLLSLLFAEQSLPFRGLGQAEQPTITGRNNYLIR